MGIVVGSHWCRDWMGDSVLQDKQQKGLFMHTGHMVCPMLLIVLPSGAVQKKNKKNRAASREGHHKRPFFQDILTCHSRKSM